MILFILDNRTWRTFHLKEVNYGCVSDHIVSFLEAAVNLDVFTMHDNAVKLVETWAVHFAWLTSLSHTGTNPTTIVSIGKFYHLSSPWNTRWHHFYPINPNAHVKMVGILKTRVLYIINQFEKLSLTTESRWLCTLIITLWSVCWSSIISESESNCFICCLMACTTAGTNDAGGRSRSSHSTSANTSGEINVSAKKGKPNLTPNLQWL